MAEIKPLMETHEISTLGFVPNSTISFGLAHGLPLGLGYNLNLSEVPQFRRTFIITAIVQVEPPCATLIFRCVDPDVDPYENWKQKLKSK